MIKQSEKIDPLLEPLLLPISDEQFEEFLSHLIATQAEPVIKGIISRNFRPNSSYDTRQADASDIYQEIIVQLLGVLQQFHEHPETYPVRDIRGLIAIIAHRACSRWMRQQFPERHALKHRLYYLLTRHRSFALWQGENKKLIAGFTIWQGQEDAATEERINQLSNDEGLLARIRLLRTGRPVSWGGTLAAIFNCLRAPIEFDRLVSVLALLLQIEDRPIESTDQFEDPFELETLTRQSDAEWQIETRIFLQKLWEEVRQLPLNQRVALLLNLRDPDGRGCIALLPILEIATLHQLAETLEMSVEALAEIWNELPLEDAKIAEVLQITRQQVINARKSARQRLTRRLKDFI